MTSVLAQAKRLVVKVGSSLVTNQGHGLDHAALARNGQSKSPSSSAALQVVLVSSGAIAEGMQRLGWRKRPHQLHEQQAAAAVGQMGLVQAYEACFRTHGLHTAQILLTHEDLSDRKRYLNARSTLRTLLDLDVIPVINENDTVATDEIRFGDNDTLAALVTNLVEADALIILTDQAGLYTRDPRRHPDAQLVAEARADDPALEQMAGGVGSHIGSGGMVTKVRAARRAARSGAHTIIASGREPRVLLRLMDGETIGTQLDGRDDDSGSAQAMARRPSAGARQADARRRRGARAQCTTARACCLSGCTNLPAISSGAKWWLLRPGGQGDRARAGELRRRRDAPHPARAEP